MPRKIWLLAVVLISSWLLAAQQSELPCTLGLEALSYESIQSLRNLRVSLVTNQTGKDMSGRRNIDVLIMRGLKPTLILVPEHGLDGKTPAGIEVSNTKDAKTKIPVISLYGHGSGKQIDQKILHDTDIFLIDLQDCGMRHFTYISTLYTILDSAAVNHKKVIVLDRPNPLGDVMEGPLVDKSLYSFVSIASIPVRHGMTIGELARYFNAYVLETPAQLHVVRMKNYDRAHGLGGKLLAPLSPNLPSVQACYGYSFLGMLGEFKPFEIGIRIGKPFQTIMLPEAISWKDSQWRALAMLLKAYGINAITFHACAKKQGTAYRGLQIQIPDITNVPCFQVLLTIVDFAQTQGLQLTLSGLGQKAIGTKNVCSYLEGTIERAKLTHAINSGITEFYKKAQTCFLYTPWPRALKLH